VIRKFLAGLTLGLFLILTTGMAEASPIYFNVAGGDSSVAGLVPSSVVITDQSSWGTTTLSTALVAGLGSNTFTLDDAEFQTFDFFTLTVSGSGLGVADIAATLAFETPTNLSASGSADLGWLTFRGKISGGFLFWDSLTLPDVFNIDGNIVSIDFQSGVKLIAGNTVTVKATVTNFGGGAPYSVPEPSMLILVGTCLFGLSGVARRKKKIT
jgi:hypothetical protein